MIVTYNPDLVRLQQNVQAIIQQVSRVFIVDNGSENISEIISLENQYSKVQFYPLPVNMGIAKALNVGMVSALSFGYNYVITLDQDSIATELLVKNLTNHMVKDEMLALVGPTINDINEDFVVKSDSAVESPFVITSGALCNLKLLKTVGFFEERLFIDCVDYDLNLRLVQAGYKVLRANDCFLAHEIGRKTKKSIWGREFYLLNHPPVRVYYMARNRVYLILRYRGVYNYSAINDLQHLLMRTIALLLFEKQPLKKLYATVTGIASGIGLYVSKR